MSTLITKTWCIISPSHKKPLAQALCCTSHNIINMAEQRLVIDDEGDVDLLVGVGKKRLRVSSKVLKMASQVFRVMFSDKYREGTELRQK